MNTKSTLDNITTLPWSTGKGVDIREWNKEWRKAKKPTNKEAKQTVDDDWWLNEEYEHYWLDGDTD